jgi:hypothetical protein
MCSTVEMPNRTTLKMTCKVLALSIKYFYDINLIIEELLFITCKTG